MINRTKYMSRKEKKVYNQTLEAVLHEVLLDNCKGIVDRINDRIEVACEKQNLDHNKFAANFSDNIEQSYNDAFNVIIKKALDWEDYYNRIDIVRRVGRKIAAELTEIHGIEFTCNI